MMSSSQPTSSSHSNLYSPLSTPQNLMNGVQNGILTDNDFAYPFEDNESKYDVPASVQEPSSLNESQNVYKKLYNALQDLKTHGVKISVPEFLFIGFQSSGKTSAVSQAAKIAVGTMKSGTASRCPTRFKLVNNPKYKTPVIRVNGAVCKGQTDLTHKLLQITKKYAEQEIFSDNIIEVKIEWCEAAELTFVDLPGLIKGDNEKFAESKKQLDRLTAGFLHETNEDGSYRYMPILVREPVDVEHDNHFEVTYIDHLVQRYGHGDKKRISWRNDTLFIVNKFDKQINRSPASSLIEYMKYCCDYGETVLTMMNPLNQSTGNMTHTQLNEYVLKVPGMEEQKWQQVIGEFENLDDENLEELKSYKQELCGVPLMNAILTDKMCNIVKKILPFIERKLASAEHAKQMEISNIIKQMEMCNPLKLKTECIEFGNRFMQFFRQFYNGSLVPEIDPKYEKSWAKEVSDFEAIYKSQSGSLLGSRSSKKTSKRAEWKYKIPPNKLQRLLEKVSNKPKPMQLLAELRVELMASAAANRIIDAWKCQVAHMGFPDYSDKDILNIAGGFGATRQPALFEAIRNVVLDAVKHLVSASNYLAEMLRYKLKENADIIFEYTLWDQFSTLDGGKGNAIIKLLQRTLRDYKAEIDHIMNEFVAIVSVGPKTQAEMLDKDYCEETINIGKLIHDLMQNNKKKQSSLDLLNKKSQFKARKMSGISKLRRGATESNLNYPPPPEGTPPPSVKKQMTLMSHNSASSRSRSSLHEDTKMEEKPEKQSKIKPKRSFGNKKAQSEMAHDLRKYDGQFYDGMFCQNTRHPITFSATTYDIKLIRHLACVFWTNIKQFIIKDTTQKVLNCVMSHVTQHDDRLTNAVQRGVNRRQIEKLLNLLVEKTGIDQVAFEQLIEEKKTIAIPKSINDLDNEELQSIYGIDRERLEKLKAQKIKELDAFQILKKQTLLKIYRIKNNEFENIDEGQLDNILNEQLDAQDSKKDTSQTAVVQID